MKLIKSTQSGTFESSDILILLEPADENSGRKIELESTVKLQYGDSILAEINRVLDAYEIDDCHLIARDKGALSATICARTETAVIRALGKEEGTL